MFYISSISDKIRVLVVHWDIYHSKELANGKAFHEQRTPVPRLVVWVTGVPYVLKISL
jgi:hypothetical protein